MGHDGLPPLPCDGRSRLAHILTLIADRVDIGLWLRSPLPDMPNQPVPRGKGTGRTAGRVGLAGAGIQPLQACLFLLPARRQL